jgi:hypothetical protein
MYRNQLATRAPWSAAQVISSARVEDQAYPFASLTRIGMIRSTGSFRGRPASEASVSAVLAFHLSEEIRAVGILRK